LVGLVVEVPAVGPEEAVAIEGGGTRLTEHWALMNRSPIMIENGEAEVEQRRANAIESLGHTLRAMKAAAEA
ncbi:MAG: hypothetical protein AAGK32_18850, partial [Actinomycetota bacterium]